MSEYKVTDYNVSTNASPQANLAALQSLAQQVAGSGGGVVIFPGYGKNNPYLLSDQVVWGSNTTLRGDGDNTVVRTTNATNNVFAAAGSPSAPLYNFNIKDMSIGTTVYKTSGAGVYLRYAARSYLQNVKIDPMEDSTWSMFDALHLDCFDDIDLDNLVLNAHHWGLALNGNSSGSWGADLYLHGGSKIMNTGNSANYPVGAVGVYVGGSVGGLSVSDTDVVYCDTGVLIDTGLTGSSNHEIFFNPGMFIDSSGADGLDLGSNSTTTLQATGVWVATSGLRTGGFAGGNGVNVAPNQPATLEVVWSGGRIFNNKGTGASFNGGSLTMSGTSVTDNGQDTTKGGDGIGIYNPSVQFVVNAHATRNGIGGPTPRGNGLYIANGCSNFVVQGRYWANGHRNIYDNSGQVNKLVNALQ